ncbi:hypothetical protein QFC21_001536 [Naganishia friedmannii]|uniref:Uncharacterized protein n=1 Tax=Naganishia friedmannii TaxID=89922 RepID=A0ACC2W3T3_9TREE|nr:hypothetical protein QFC21_001536 [Naganishia friedmannii]
MPKVPSTYQLDLKDDSEYVEGFDDPSANVVLIGSDMKALRVHDYYLKASRWVVFFREMFEAGTKGGPIGLDENSMLLEFVLTKAVGRRPTYSLISDIIGAQESGSVGTVIKVLIRLHAVSPKYIFEEVNRFILDLMADYASDHPPLALRFAVNLQPPNEAIIRAALVNFSNRMPKSFADAFSHAYPSSSPTETRYSPAAESLSKSYVRSLGLDAFCAYVRALKEGSTGTNSWDWRIVADSFMKQLDIATPKGGNGKLAIYRELANI